MATALFLAGPLALGLLLLPARGEPSSPGPWASVMPGPREWETTKAQNELNAAAVRRSQALSLYYKAWRLERESDDEAALEAYTAAAGLDPSNARLTGRMVRILTGMGRIDDALRALESLAARHPDQPGPLVALSRFCARYHQGSPQMQARGMQLAQQAVEKFPDSAEAAEHLVRLYLNAGERASAEDVIQRAAKSTTSDPGYWLRLSRAARNAYPFDDPDTRTANRAIVGGFIDKALTNGKGDPGVEEAVADFHARNGDVEKAIPLYRSLMESRPDDLPARQKLGQCLRIAGGEDEAVRIFEDLIQINAADVVSHRALAEIYEARNENSKATPHHAALLKLEGGEPEDYARLAGEMMRQDQAAEALTLLKRGVFDHPDHPLLLMLQARALDTLRQPADALETMNAAAAAAEKTAPGMLDDNFYYSWASLSLRGGKPDDAETRYRKSIELTPADKPERAARAYNDLGFLWLTKGDRLEEAGELIRTANEMQKDHPGWLDSLGWFHYLKKDYATAITTLERAVSLTRGKPPAELLDHLALALCAAGRKADALARLTEAAALPEATPEMKARLVSWQNPDAAVTDKP